ncbi:MAG: CARDB domain-containing protein [Thermoplasmatota archaeon]
MRGSMEYHKSYLLSFSILLILVSGSYIELIADVIPEDSKRDYHAFGCDDENVLRSDDISPIGPLGSLEWQVDLPDPLNGQVSTPCIADLDLDGYQEILVMTQNGILMAYNHNGTDYWDAPVILNINSIGDFEDPTTGNFDPPRFFPSPVVGDITDGPRPEVLICSYSGLVCLGANGTQLWKTGETSGCYFGTPCITDLNGTFGGKEDLEIIVTSSAHNNTNWIEVISGDGDILSRNRINTSLILGSTPVAQDLQGSAWDGPWQSLDPRGNDPTTELVFTSFGNFINIIDPSYENGSLVMNITANATGGNYNLATPVVMNITGSPDCEIIVGTSEGSGSGWDEWSGYLRVFNSSGEEIWNYNLSGNGSAVMSSPAIMTRDRYYNDSDDRLRWEYDIIFGSDDGFIYCLNSSSRDVRWKYNAWDRIRSSPAVFDWTGEEDYAVVVGTDRGRIYCLELDPSEGIDHGMPFTGDGPMQDVIWGYDQGISVGFSSPVISDIDLDRVPEVLIGDSEGNLLCIAGGGGTGTFQSEWTSFHGNENRTGYSGFIDRYRIDLYPTVRKAVRDSTIKEIKSGESTLFNITLENKCKLLEKDELMRIDLEVDNEYSDEGWYCRLDTPSYKGDEDPPYSWLRCGDVANLILHVYSPLKEFRIRGQIFKFNVTATLDGHPLYWDRMVLSVVMDVMTGLKMEFDAPVLEDPDDLLNGSKTMCITNGGSITADLIVENTGDVNDTFDIQLNEPPDYWDWYFNDSGTREITINLSTPMFDNEDHVVEAVLSIHIECHEDAMGEMIGSIEAVSNSLFMESSGFPYEFFSDILYIRVNESRYLEMNVDEPIVTTKPGEVVQFAISLTSTGNTYLNTAYLGFTNLTSDWNGFLSENPVSLILMETKIVYLNMTVPWDEKAGVIIDIDLTAYLYPDKGGRNKLSLQVVVEQVHSIRAELTDDIVSGDPGDILFSGITIENKGNGLEEIDLHVDDNDLFTMSFTMVEWIPFEPVALSPGDDLSIRTRIYIKNSARAGIYSSPIIIISSGGNISLDQMINVRTIHSLEITSLQGDAIISESIRPGGSSDLILKVTNTGNGLSTIRAHFNDDEVRDDPLNISKWHQWESTFTWISKEKTATAVNGMVPGNEIVNTTIMEPADKFGFTSDSGIDRIEVILESGGCLYIGFRVDFLHFSMGDRSRSIQFGINGIPIEGGGGDRVECILPILLPDLKFGWEPSLLSRDGSLISTSEDGDTVILKGSVSNTGDYEAEKIRVVLYIDEEFIDEFLIQYLDTGSLAPFEFEFTLDAGDHVIRIEIDPDNKIIEDRDQFSNGGAFNNNVFSTGFGVQETDGSGSGTQLAVILFVVPILILIVVLIFLTRRFGGGKPLSEE